MFGCIQITFLGGSRYVQSLGGTGGDFGVGVERDGIGVVVVFGEKHGFEVLTILHTESQ